jgi:hypothetical protein
MKCHVLWYGGSNYANPDPSNPRDWEAFDSLAQARRTFESRENSDPYYPCVEGDEMHVYFAEEYHENGPDVILSRGPRGGIRQERG